jgi:hypothetical protein
MVLPFLGWIFGGMIKAACTPEVMECRSPMPDFPDAPAGIQPRRIREWEIGRERNKDALARMRRRGLWPMQLRSHVHAYLFHCPVVVRKYRLLF